MPKIQIPSKGRKTSKCRYRTSLLPIVEKNYEIKPLKKARRKTSAVKLISSENVTKNPDTSNSHAIHCYSDKGLSQKNEMLIRSTGLPCQKCTNTKCSALVLEFPRYQPRNYLKP